MYTEGGTTPRDERIAGDIGKAENAVLELVQLLGRIFDHAMENEATAHAGLYEQVQAHLSSAAKDLNRAYDVMLNGDPEDYA